MKTLIRPAISLLLLLTLITGGLYPAVATGLAQAWFAHQAHGSLVIDNGQAVGSELIGQGFSAPRYFWPRPSATSPGPYDGANSGGSNLGPLNPALQEAVKARIAALRAADPGNPLPVPVDLVTASASGLDPHISPAAARYQAGRVARLRQLAPQAVEALISQYTEPPLLGFLGEERVSVLALNRALDRVAPQ